MRCVPGAAEQRCGGLWDRTVPETALSSHGGSSDNQVRWEHCGLLSRCNKCLGNLRPVEKNICMVQVPPLLMQKAPSLTLLKTNA